MTPGPEQRRFTPTGRRRYRRVALWAPVALLASMLASCSTTSGQPRVSVIGDSITALAQPDISAALGPSYDIDYVFRISVRIDQLLGLVAADQQAHGPTAAAVINLGTNDAIAGGTDTHAPASFDRLVTAVDAVPCVVLTTIGPFADERGRSDVGAALNRTMVGLASADPTRYKVVDWNRFVTGLDSQRRPSFLQPDLIHETPAGARWIAASDKAALDTCGTEAQAPLVRPPGS